MLSIYKPRPFFFFLSGNPRRPEVFAELHSSWDVDAAVSIVLAHFFIPPFDTSYSPKDLGTWCLVETDERNRPLFWWNYVLVRQSTTTAHTQRQ